MTKPTVKCSFFCIQNLTPPDSHLLALHHIYLALALIGSQDVNMLITHLYKHAYKWREIGGALGFEQGELENIRATGGTPQQLLTKLLTK